MPEARPVIVVDADVLVAYARNPDRSPARHVFQEIAADNAELTVSFTLWNQYQCCLWHPEFLERSGKSPAEVDTILSFIADKAEAIEKVPHQVDLHRSPEDEHVINLAVYREADFVVSRDKGLLELDNNKAWKEWYPTIRVISPAAFSRELALWQEQQQQLEQKQDRGPSLSW